MKIRLLKELIMEKGYQHHWDVMMMGEYEYSSETDIEECPEDWGYSILVVEDQNGNWVGRTLGVTRHHGNKYHFDEKWYETHLKDDTEVSLTLELAKALGVPELGETSAVVFMKV